ncbi:MAG: hypothetical protein LJE58_09420, partial [Thiogranum sp.]|nr:hypothetical protein [Thiogranum sp.]
AFGKVITECLHSSERKEARRLRDIRNVYWDAQFDSARTTRDPKAQSTAVLDFLPTDARNDATPSH